MGTIRGRVLYEEIRYIVWKESAERPHSHVDWVILSPAVLKIRRSHMPESIVFTNIPEYHLLWIKYLPLKIWPESFHSNCRVSIRHWPLRFLCPQAIALWQYLFQKSIKINSMLNAQQRFAFLCYSWNRVYRVPRFRCVKHPIHLEALKPSSHLQMSLSMGVMLHCAAVHSALLHYCRYYLILSRNYEAHS